MKWNKIMQEFHECSRILDGEKKAGHSFKTEQTAFLKQLNPPGNWCILIMFCTVAFRKFWMHSPSMVRNMRMSCLKPSFLLVTWEVPARPLGVFFREIINSGKQDCFYRIRILHNGFLLRLKIKYILQIQGPLSFPLKPIRNESGRRACSSTCPDRWCA